MVTAYPDVVVKPMNKDVEFIILACDGLWDIMEDHEAVAIVRIFLKFQQDISNNNDGQPLNTYDLRDKAAQILCKEALKTNNPSICS